MSSQDAIELEEKLKAAQDAMSKVIRQGARIKAMRPLAKQIIVTDREDEEEEEEEEE